MPEMPEVQGLVDFLRGRATGLTIKESETTWADALRERNGDADKPVDAAASKLKEKLSKGAPKAEKPDDAAKEG